MANGIQLYIDQVNSTMGGRKVELIIENDGSDAATAVQKLQKLVDEDHVNVVDGIMLANISAAVVPMAEKEQIPMVGAVCTSDDLTQRQNLTWFVRTGYTSSQPMLPFGEWVYKNLHYRKIVTLAMDYRFGYEQVGGFQKSFEGAGGQIVQKIWAPLGFVDFSSFIKQIHKDADAVMLVSVGAAAEVMPKQYKELGPGLPVIGSGSSYDEFILNKLGDESVGVYSPLIYSAALKTPANLKFAAAYRAQFHKDPSYYAECSYTSGMWIKQAIDSLQGKVEDKQRFIEALKKVQLKDAPRGPVRLDPRNSPIENVYVRKVERVHGALQNTVIQTFPNVSQFWKWKDSDYLKQPIFSKEYPPCPHCQ